MKRKYLRQSIIILFFLCGDVVEEQLCLRVFNTSEGDIIRQSFNFFNRGGYCMYQLTLRTQNFVYTGYLCMSYDYEKQLLFFYTYLTNREVY
jgi:hypothetical protein